MRAGSKWSCTNPVNDNWIEGDLYNSLSMTAALVHTTLYTRLCTHGLVATCPKTPCVLRPRVQVVCSNHDLYTWPVHMARTHGLVHASHGLPGSHAKVRWKA